MRTRIALSAFVLVVLAAGALAQTGVPATGTPAVPPVIRFSGTLGQPAGPVTVTFGLYRDQMGGAPLWTERQTIVVDASGHYAVVLGGATAEGLPLAVFANGEACWVGVQVDGQAEAPRVMLLSVPYALKAGDATTVGGKPLSAFVLAGETTGVGADGLTYVNTQALSKGLSTAGAGGLQTSSGNPGYIGVFTSTTDLGNSLIYQTGSNIGVNTTAPLAGLHAMSNVAPVAFFDVYSPVLTALPVVYRAARGSISAPSAVQNGDIIGGLAARGFGSSVFSPGGRGQVAFKAAENWTDNANGTYLTIATTPTGSKTLTERMRVGANGYVGFGTTTPAFPIDERLGGPTYAAFGYGSASPLFLTSNYAQIGFNLYYSGAYRYGWSGPAGYLAFGQDGVGAFSFATATSGTADASAASAITPRMVITNAGQVGIGTTAPTDVLDVEGGNIRTSGYVTAVGGSSTFTDPSTDGTGLEGNAPNGNNAWGVWGLSSPGLGVFGQSTTGTGVLGQVDSGSGVYAGNFKVIGGTTGKALGASVNNVETMYVDADGVHGGPGLTGTPVAYASINADGSTAAGSSNISCTAGSGYYDCTIAGYSYYTWVAVVTAVNLNTHPIIAISSTGGANVLRVRLFDLYTGTATLVQNAFHVVVFKP